MAHRRLGLLSNLGRIFFACLTIAAIATQAGYIASQGLRLSNFFSFFTIESNAFAAAMLLATAYFGLTKKRAAKLTMLRGASTLYMTITGFVYILLLRNVDVQTSEAWINTVLHYIMPVVMLADWSFTLPEARIGLKQALIWLAYPFAYLAYSMIRGSLVDWYPYPFLNPAENGYGVVALMSLLLIAFAALVLVALVKIVAGGRPKPAT